MQFECVQNAGNGFSVSKIFPSFIHLILSTKLKLQINCTLSPDCRKQCGFIELKFFYCVGGLGGGRAGCPEGGGASRSVSSQLKIWHILPPIF